MKPGDRVRITLPEAAPTGPRRWRRYTRVTGTVVELDLPGLPPGVHIQLDRPVNGANTCYAGHSEVTVLPDQATHDDQGDHV
jgi:hypothetical protein